MILRLLNEFVRESVCLALEPARECIASCTYCFANLNSKSQYANRVKSTEDSGSFERTLEKAHSPSYDATDFLQWALAECLPLGLANTVEPFQDVKQARSCLSICNNFDIPLFIQSKGVNFDQVKDLLVPLADNASFFVSMPSLDRRVVKRFEPGTPSIADRLKMIEWLREHDFWVIAALSPYHEEWCQDPDKLIDDLADVGVNEVFVDRLHLNARQAAAATDPVMVSLAGGRGKPVPLEYIDHLKAIHAACLANELDIVINGFDGVMYGLYNTLPGISPDEVFKRGNPWPYHDGRIFDVLQRCFYEDGMHPGSRDPGDSMLFTWSDCLQIMEMAGEVEQEFTYRSLYDIVPIGRKLTDAWTATVRPTATMPQFFRAIYNHPYESAFVWRHPWIAVAARPDGLPWLDDDGNIIGLFDPDVLGRDRRMFRRVESLDPFRRLDITYHEDEDEE